jgi:hypothetical protein
MRPNGPFIAFEARGETKLTLKLVSLLPRLGPKIRLNANSSCSGGRRCDSLVREFTQAWRGRNEKQ